MNRHDKMNDHRYGVTGYNKRLIKRYRRLFITSFIICIGLVCYVVQLNHDLKYTKIENDLYKINEENRSFDMKSMQSEIDSLVFKNVLPIDTFKPKILKIKLDTTKLKIDTLKIDTIIELKEDTTTNDTIQ